MGVRRGRSSTRVSGRKIARVKPLGQQRLRRAGINNGIQLGLYNGVRTFTVADVPAMMDDDQVSLGLEYVKIPIAQAPIAVKVEGADPAAKEWTDDLVQRIWNALIPKLDLSLCYGENAYEAMYKKDPKAPGCWDFVDFDVAPPMSAIPWVVNDRIAMIAVHESSMVSGYSYYWFETDELGPDTSILEGAGVYRPAKGIWIANDPLTSRWFGRSILRAAHLRWRAKNMPDGALENFAKATYRASFSGLLIRYPAGESIVDESGNIIPSEQYADFLLQVIKSGSNVRLPAPVENMPGWSIEQYATTPVDLSKLQVPLDYLDKGIMRGMGIPDEILTHDGNTGGYSRSLVSIDAFYSRGETRALGFLPTIMTDIVNPLGRQRYGRNYEATAHILKQDRPGDGQDDNNNGIPDALEGAMGQRDGDGDGKIGERDNGQQNGQQNGVKQFPNKFSLLVNRIKDRASADALCMSSSKQWDSDLHPRESAGGPHGGEFTSKPNVGRSKRSIQFSKPIIGPTGAAIHSYDWQYKLEDMGVDKRGEEITKRVSDWDASTPSHETGREIVHHFMVTDQSGKTKIVSLESALSLLGYDSKSAEGKSVKSVASSLKTRAKLQMQLDQQKSVAERYEDAEDNARSAALKLPMPEVEHKPFLGGNNDSHWEARIGDAYQAYFTSADSTNNYHNKMMAESEARKSWIDKRKKELIDKDIRKEADELFGTGVPLWNMKQHIKETEKRIEKMDKKISLFSLEK